MLLGFYLTRRASQSIEHFFLGGRKMSWWIIGVSMAATNLSIDTPISITKFIVKEGIGGVWFFWSNAISAVLVTFLFSKLWRRAEVVTDAELIELRYSGKSAAFLRLFKGFYFGVIFNAFIMGWVFLALIKVMSAITTADISIVLAVTTVLVFAYTLASGFYGVLITDFFQYFVALGGAILLAYFSVQRVGGLDTLISSYQGDPAIDFIPSYSLSSVDSMVTPFSVFLTYLFVQWWAHKYADGGGKHIQRMLSAKNENHSFLGSLLYSFLTYSVQVWPWIVTVLCGMMILGETSDPEMIYPLMIKEVLPAGAMGLVLASLLGAFMSTIDTHLNLGASYMVNDIYKRFWVKDASAKHYVWVSRLMMAILLLLSIGISLNMTSVSGAWKFLLTFASGAGLTWIVRWFWWRANAWTEISGMVSSGVIASYIGYFHSDWLYSTKILTVVSLSTVIWVVVTFLTPPVKEDVLVGFVKKIRPGSPGWKKVCDRHDISQEPFLFRGIASALIGIVCFFCFNFSVGNFVLGSTALAVGLMIIAIALFYVLLRQVNLKKV